jgi:hypothetical protein
MSSADERRWAQMLDSTRETRVLPNVYLHHLRMINGVTCADDLRIKDRKTRINWRSCGRGFPDPVGQTIVSEESGVATAIFPAARIKLLIAELLCRSLKFIAAVTASQSNTQSSDKSRGATLRGAEHKDRDFMDGKKVGQTRRKAKPRKMKTIIIVVARARR